MHPSRVSSWILATALVVVALPLAMGQSGLRSRDQRVALTAKDASGSDEVLVAELSCRLQPFDPGTQIAFSTRGTIGVATGGMGELASAVVTVPENFCSEFHQAASSAIEGLVCFFGLITNGSLPFVCHDQRDAVLNVMATVSRAVVTGAF